jgi:hypothetical protein
MPAADAMGKTLICKTVPGRRLKGLYLSASITVPDSAQNCANFVLFSIGGVVKTGVDAQGYPTCTFPAGTPDGKYTVLLNSYD